MREKRNQKILRVLVSALDNIVREAEFFKKTSQDWGLDIERWEERKATRDYTAEMARVSGSRSLEEGLIFLWAMERVSMSMIWYGTLPGTKTEALGLFGCLEICTVDDESASH